MNSNHLINESSPYLLQHAHNPVDWHAWNEESLKKAREADKPIIVSIGYSTCHWCHVMERESFENKDIADVMNAHFICIKVDREERPDVDQVYMDALHAMGLQGGWPLNVFLTPDQKPFYGGTYFPAKGWKGLLLNIAEVYQSKRDALEDSARKFEQALNRDPLGDFGIGATPITKNSLDNINTNLAKGFDTEKGGMGAAPKFPMPAIWKYMIQYLCQNPQQQLSDQLHLTLEKIALGGIYDQVGGGFARYSTDAHWFAPHFEKMLYDNGQLLSIYSSAYRLKPYKLYKDAIYQIVGWLSREMLDDKGGFYSALDADSEGEEGKFYVWTEQELKNSLGDDISFAKAYYNTTSAGNWEHNWNILYRKVDDQAFCKQNSIDEVALEKLVASVNSQLLEKRSQRIRPGLDNKILSGWNALMTKGLLDAYSVFGEESFIGLAVKNLQYILNELIVGDELYHSGGKQIRGFMDDYALVIEVLTEAYQVTFEESYLQTAKNLTDHCIEHFYDKEKKFFFYTSRRSERLIADKKEIYDNVIPASNSVMASNTLKLAVILDNQEYHDIGSSMVGALAPLIEKEPRYMSNWAGVLHQAIHPPFEVVIVGDRALEFRNELSKHALPNHIFAGTTTASELPLIQDRIALDGQTTIYVCRNRTCQLPVHTVQDALQQMGLSV